MTGKVAEDAQFQPVRYGNYLLLDRINVGGMAEVFRAKSSGMAGVERLVAIKRILPHLAQDQGFTNMFIDEARIAINLRHANIAQLYELNQTDSSLFIAMEYLQGRDLRALINRMRFIGRAIPLPLVVYIISKVCEGLDYAHRKRDDLTMRDLNIVHRDVSPQNVLLSYEGEVKIIDFGIAKATAKKTHTQAGILKGKFGYMAPEQVMGREIDRRADIFCTGILAYELLTRERLFAGSNELSTLRRIRQREITPPTIINPDVPVAIEETILKALALEPEDRFQYASDFGEALQKALHEVGEEPYSSRHLRTFMYEVFGKDLKEDLQRLEMVLQAASAMDDPEAGWDKKDQPLPAAPSHESMTEGTNEQTNPSWRGDSLAVALGESQKEAHYPDTPSPFSEQSSHDTEDHDDEEPTNPRAESHRGAGTWGSRSPSASSSLDWKQEESTQNSYPLSSQARSREGRSAALSTQPSKISSPPQAGRAHASRDAFSTQETHFVDGWKGQAGHASAAPEDEEFMELTSSHMVKEPSFPELQQVIDCESTEDLAQVRKVDYATQEMDEVGPSLHGSLEESTASSHFSSAGVSSPSNPIPERFSVAPVPVRRGGEVHSQPGEMSSPTLHRPSPSRSAPRLQVESKYRKKSNLKVWLLMWSFLLLSLAGLLYLLLIVPAPNSTNMYRSKTKRKSPSRPVTAPPSDRSKVTPTQRRAAISPAVKPRTPAGGAASVKPVSRRRPAPVAAVKVSKKRVSAPQVRKKKYSLWINSVPSGVELFVNGKLRGRTPKILSTTKRSVRVELRMNGYKSLSRTWVWSGKTSAQVSWKLSKARALRKGYLTVTATPKAIIYINGMTTDKTSLQRRAVSSGSYQLSFVTKNGEVWDEKVKVRPGKETKIHSKYKRK